jgi:hypothetical protein
VTVSTRPLNTTRDTRVSRGKQIHAHTCSSAFVRRETVAKAPGAPTPPHPTPTTPPPCAVQQAGCLLSLPRPSFHTRQQQRQTEGGWGVTLPPQKPFTVGHTRGRRGPWMAATCSPAAHTPQGSWWASHSPRRGSGCLDRGGGGTQSHGPKQRATGNKPARQH